MNRKNLIALSFLALVSSNAAFAQAEGREGYLREYGIDLRPSVSSHASVFGSGTQERRETNPIASHNADYLREYAIDLRPVMSSVTREEVLAELQIYRESGLDELERGERGADVHSVAHQRATAKYAELRSSPEFGDRVEQIARQRGKPVIVVGR
jgi:hypothetical protein